MKAKKHESWKNLKAFQTPGEIRLILLFLFVARFGPYWAMQAITFGFSYFALLLVGSAASAPVAGARQSASICADEAKLRSYSSISNCLSSPRPY
jgi:hypothetical protein